MLGIVAGACDSLGFVHNGSMRTHTLERTVYTLLELKDADASAYERALARLASDAIEYADLSWQVDEFKGICATLGIDVDRVDYSVGWSQSDFCAIVGRYAYAKGAVKALTAEFPQWTRLHRVARELQDAQRTYFYKVCATLSSSHRYNGQSVEVSHDDYYKDVSKECEDAVSQAFLDLAHEFYIQLRDQLEYMSSEAELLEMAEANEWEFDEHGNLV